MAEIITGDGRVTIPEAVRDRLGITPGSFVEFEVTPDGWVVLTKAAEEMPRPRGGFERFIGVAGPGPTTDS
jgi:antitoxin PrlF